jgi:phosphohistidine phosphatase
MELYLLRHAHAGDPAKWRGDDAERPLSAKGRRQSERLGALLASISFRPDALVSSPKLRALETARIVGKAIRVEPSVDDRLASCFDIRALATLVEERNGPERLVLVGHDPDLSELLAELIGASSVAMRKGALARVDLEGRPAPGDGALRWLVPPDVLDALADQ